MMVVRSKPNFIFRSDKFYEHVKKYHTTPTVTTQVMTVTTNIAETDGATAGNFNTWFWFSSLYWSF